MFGLKKKKSLQQIMNSEHSLAVKLVNIAKHKSTKEEKRGFIGGKVFELYAQQIKRGVSPSIEKVNCHELRDIRLLSSLMAALRLSEKDKLTKDKARQLQDLIEAKQKEEHAFDVYHEYCHGMKQIQQVFERVKQSSVN